MLRPNAPSFHPRCPIPTPVETSASASTSSGGAAHTTGTDRPGPPTAAAHHPGPAEPGGRGVSRLRPGGLSGAGYLWTRCLREGGVDAQTFDTFVRAQGAIDRTRAQLPWGRGNVLGDAIQTAQASTLRNVTSREGLPVSGTPAWDRASDTAQLAAEARFMEAGNCAEFAALVQVNLAAHLAPNERIDLLDSAGADHTWPELVQAHGSDAPTRWALDAWSEGTAMRLEDTRLASTTDRVVTHRVAPSDAPALAQVHQMRLAQLQANAMPEAVLEKMRGAMRAKNEVMGPPDFAQPLIWRPEIEAELRARVEADRAHGPAAEGEGEPDWSPAHHPLRRVLPDVAAQAVVRQYGAGVAEAAALVPLVIEAGLTLSQLERAPARQATGVAQQAMQKRLQNLYEKLGETPRRDPSRPHERA